MVDPSPAPFDAPPVMLMNAVEPLCVTFASISLYLSAVVSDICMWYLALLYVDVLNESMFCVVESPVKVAVPSSMLVESNKMGEVNHASCPLPSVCNTWPAVPSELGNDTPLMLTYPVPLALNSRSEFDALADIVLSLTVTPSMTSAELL